MDSEEKIISIALIGCAVLCLCVSSYSLGYERGVRKKK